MEMRQPPRFVPTLTDVVTEQNASMAEAPALIDPETFLPAICPPLSESPVGHAVVQESIPVAVQTATGALQIPHETESEDQQIAHILQTQVMQRLEHQLRERLTAEFEKLIALHTQRLCQAMQEDIERLIAHALQEILLEEQKQEQESVQGSPKP